MRDLNIRVGFWKRHHITKYQGGSPVKTYESLPNWESIFKDKDVLEIGPGEGRQTWGMKDISKSLAVADIVPEVLKIYTGMDAFLIEDYKEDFHKKFDVIAFWYVIHHVMKDEKDDFMGLLKRHLKEDGKICFNFSLEGGPGNGLKTTGWTLGEIAELLKCHGFAIEGEKFVADNCYVILAKRNTNA